MAKINVQVPEKLLPLITTPKREKIIIGGRGGGKSISVGDIMLRHCDGGHRVCCAREFQNTIDESVHAQLCERIPELGASETLTYSASRINSLRGGEIFYKGLSRNILGFKSTYGIKYLWIEEGQGLTQNTIETVIPTIREEGSEIWITANRGSSNDAFSQHYLKPYEKALAANKGYYEDDEILIIEINWWENPFFPKTLEKQRRKDKRIMPASRYDHIWNGGYSDTVQNAIILPEWFDACIDAHELIKGWKRSGVEVVSHDPADEGADAKALCYRHGSVIIDVQQKTDGDIHDAADWAIDYALEVKADEFIWDEGGLGAGLRRDFKNAFDGKHVNLSPFNGGSGVDNPDAVYEQIDSEIRKAATNYDLFRNKRAQYYWNLRDRCFRTYLAVTKGIFTDPDEMISFCSTIDDIDILRAEICSVPRKTNGAGKIQMLSKDEMKRPPYSLPSPNMADAVMMALSGGVIKRKDRAMGPPPKVLSRKRSSSRLARGA